MIGCPCRKLDPHVSVMQSTKYRAADYTTSGLNGLILKWDKQGD